jgi:16S rRNA (cytosine967-C5)-methyltransferase
VSRPAAGRRGRADTVPGPTGRSVALDVVRRVIDEGAYSNLALARTIERAGLNERDAALASELTYGTLRRKLALDHALAPLLERPLETAPKAARSLLRLGAYQLLFTRIPPHAAVSETVALADPRHRGFVNAVLRRLAKQGVRWPEGDSDDEVSVRTGLAAWAVRELRRQLGDDAEAAATALAERTRTTIRTNTCRVTVDELERSLLGAGVELERGDLHLGSFRLASGAPASLPGFHEGWFAVQDEASSFVVEALGPHAGDRVLDACAGPGGKAGHIACLVGPDGELVAADTSPARARLVRATLDRLGVRGRLLVQDARRPALAGPFDAVLVDAPCSGLGSARRRPELLWRSSREELSGLARLQVSIVVGLADLVRPGGRLVYSVCTFPRAETDAACDAILRRRPDLVPFELEGPEGPAPRIRLWPHEHDCDAMFVAGFRRSATRH